MSPAITNILFKSLAITNTFCIRAIIKNNLCTSPFITNYLTNFHKLLLTFFHIAWETDQRCHGIAEWTSATRESWTKQRDVFQWSSLCYCHTGWNGDIVHEPEAPVENERGNGGHRTHFEHPRSGMVDEHDAEIG